MVTCAYVYRLTNIQVTHPPALAPSFTSDWFVKDKAGVLIIN